MNFTVYLLVTVLNAACIYLFIKFINKYGS